MSSLKFDKIVEVNHFLDSGLKVGKMRFRDFSEVKVCYSNTNVKFENFMFSEWRDYKFLKGSVCHKMRLRF